MNGLPTIVVPKGRLSEQIIRLFKIIGYELPDIERTVYKNLRKTYKLDLSFYFLLQPVTAF